jgi:hypothetical protein
MRPNASEYLRGTSAAMAERYDRDCVTHACALAEALRAEGARPWIGRLRDVERRGAATFHHPLIPTRFPALTWNTHYVCGSGAIIFDPLLDQPIGVGDYALAVFGRALKVETFLDADETEHLLKEGTLRLAFRPLATQPPHRKRETRTR